MSRSCFQTPDLSPYEARRSRSRWNGKVVILMATLAMVVLSGVFYLSAQPTEQATPKPSVDEILKAESRYVGVNVCGDCHSKQRIGEQFQAWAGSRHPRAGMMLNTGYPDMVPPQARGMVKVGFGKVIREEAERLGQETKCLKCHGTAADVDADLREPTFHMEDGVQCEACHGPGSRHAAWYREYGRSKRRQPPKEAHLGKPELDKCLDCHREKTSHALLKRPPFDPEKAWAKIKHGLPEED